MRGKRENLQKSDFRSTPPPVAVGRKGKDVDWRVIAEKEEGASLSSIGREMMLIVIAYLQMEKQRDILDLGKK